MSTTCIYNHQKKKNGSRTEKNVSKRLQIKIYP